MKKIYFLVSVACLSLFFTSCKKEVKDSKQQAIDLMTAQTLGLAYLEEFKIKEAEKEFLKVIKLAPNKKLGYANLGLVYLRMGKYADAEKQLFKAIKIASKDADVRLLLATVYQMDNKRNKAITTLLNALKLAPNHVKILYDLSELYAAENNEVAQLKRQKYVLQLVHKAPGNIVPYLDLIEIYIRKGQNDKAIAQLEIILKQFQEFPKEAVSYYDKTVALLKKADSKNAFISYTIFQNYLKVTAPYQKGIMDLKGPGGSLIGFPLITYDQQSSSLLNEDESIMDVIKFTDITKSAGLSFETTNNTNQLDTVNDTHVAAADYDGDGDIDLYVSKFDEKTATYQHYLFNNDLARFSDVAADYGLNHSGKESQATFVDYDNDGFLDLFITKNSGDLLYRNAGKNHFEDVTNKAKIGLKHGGIKPLFFDLDHDGDLDLFEIGQHQNVVFRNNGDGTFTEKSHKMGLSLKDTNSTDAAFGDIDDDGDIDLFVTNKNSVNNLYSNERQGVFSDVANQFGINSEGNSSGVAIGDYNNDGFLDLFVTSLNGNQKLYKNTGAGAFKVIKNCNKIFMALKNIKVFDSKFFDFDNDGFLDIVVVGESKNNKERGVFIYHNKGNDKFEDVSKILPNKPISGKQITLFDYNSDGDLDLIISGNHGQIFLLRNDGGNLNHYVDMRLVGLRTGSAKNNYFGIGAKVEMRSGDLYQTSVVTNPNVHFGLGNRTKADVIRITWTNGVPQNIFLPDADQSLIESQILKGSCPFLYTWNGKKYVFTKDIIWRSALGMPLGIMGGNTMHAFADASDDYIKIPKSALKQKDGNYLMQVTSELWETIYIDQLQLVAVDHPDSVDVFVPEQFSPPPFPGLDIHQVRKKYLPISATDAKGNDVLKFVSAKDDNYLSNFKLGKYQGITKKHDLILDPGPAGNLKNLNLFLYGWIFPTDASINLALSQSDKLQLIRPSVQVKNKQGKWVTVIKNLGFPMGKDKYVIANLSGKFLSDDHRIRIQTNMEIYWDQIFFADSNVKSPIVSSVLNPSVANIHYRGFSATYKKGGRYGPHWFDYYKVDKNKKWRDLIGNYTRYGDVKPLLQASDNKYIISNAGDETSLKFDVNKLPKLKRGWTRDFFIHSVGWVKDGDINTALGNKVLPLPFHGMSSYPPAKQDKYPQNADLKSYNKTYNTRIVTMDTYRNAIKKANK